jgi:hypothetical protein
MDELLKKALDVSSYRTSFELQKKTIKEKLEAKLTFGYNGGLFKIDSDLICFIDFLIRHGRESNVPILDSNNNPILIENINNFKIEILDRYFSGCNSYFEDLEKLKKNRSVEKLVGYYE